MDVGDSEADSSVTIVRKNDVSVEDQENVEECGCEVRCWCFRTRRRSIAAFSSLNNSTAALIFLSLVAFLEGMIVNGLYNVSVSTLEKRFGLRSFETGLITSALDIAGSAATLVTAYIGGAGHKPLWIGCGVLIMGVGSLVFSMPHFLAPPYSPDIGSITDCAMTGSCNESSLRPFRGFFFIGFILVGVGATPLYTLAISYLDENVRQSRSAMFSGIYFASALLGPGIGFILGGVMLQMFTTMDAPPVGVTEESPSWVGNWWLAFVIVGSSFIVLSIPLFMYPRRIPGTEKHRADRENEVQHSVESVKAQQEENFGMRIKDAPRSAWILAKNPTVMSISVATAVDSGLLIGLATFGPKYIESLYGLTAANAGFYFGALAIVCASSGHLISGAIITRWNLNVLQMLKMCVGTSIVSFACYFILISTCDNPRIVGGFIPYPGRNTTCEMSSCGCRSSSYSPVCGSDNLTYLSSCHAGCVESEPNGYANCSRLNWTDTTMPRTAEDGRCPSDYASCPDMALYLVTLGLAVFLTFFNAQPALQCSLRVVLFSQRSFCLGFQWIITRVLGSIPVPIIFGKVLDLSCQVWREECRECTSCYVYDNLSMSYYLTFLCVSLKGISMLCILYATWTYKAPLARDEDETTTEDTRM